MNPEDLVDDDDIRDILEDAMEGEEEEYGEDDLEPLTDDEIEGIVSTAIDDAVDFIESDIAPDRIKAQRYFDGEVDIGYEDGRSRVVATKVRDTVRAVKPSLMRIFLSSGRYVEYVPRQPEDVQIAEQATEYMHYKFQEMGGFRILSDVFHDALIKKVGIAKAYYEEYDTSEIHTFTGLNDAQYMAVVMDPDVEILEHSEEIVGEQVMAEGVETPMMVEKTHDVKVMRRSSDGDICVVSIPPEEFFIDRGARSIDDCYICGHRTDMRVGDLVAMGFDFDEVSNLDGSTDVIDTTAQEEEERRGYPINPDEDENPRDPSMKKVLVTEAYMRIDADGTGIPILHRVIMGGTSYKLLDIEPWDEIPFAIFEVDPEPHAFFGRSVADLLVDDQDAATAIMRGVLDNVAMTNTPRIGIVDGSVDIDDVLNNEIGGIIRMTQPGAVQPFAIPFTAAQTLPAMQYLDQMIEGKTGVTRASMGLDPDALQSTTKAAVTATVQAAAGQTEVMARNLAEGGMRRLFSLLLKLTVKHADAPKFMRLNGQFAPVDPRAWDIGMDVSVNVGLGTGGEDQKAAAYREILALQMQVYQGYGPQNGVVGLSNIRNTVADMLASSGVRNSERYFRPITPEYEQQLMMQAMMQEQQQGQASNPQQAYLQAEGMKAQTRAQVDMQKAAMEHQRKLMEMAASDDLKRDEMAQDLLVQAAKILGQYGTSVDVARVQAEQNRQRQFMGQ
jgi:hypothetical protein